MQAAPASTLGTGDSLAAISPLPLSSLAASLRGLLIGLSLVLLAALAGAALASATVGYPIGRLG